MHNLAVESSRFGIVYNGVTDGCIADNSISNTELTALQLGTSTNTTATRNTITGGGTGILLTEATENLIYANTVTGNRLNGIDLLNSTDNRIDENTSEDNGEYGVSLSSSNDNSVTNNSLANNRLGPCFVVDSTGNTFEDDDPECEATNNGMTEPPERPPADS